MYKNHLQSHAFSLLEYKNIYINSTALKPFIMFKLVYRQYFKAKIWNILPFPHFVTCIFSSCEFIVSLIYCKSKSKKNFISQTIQIKNDLPLPLTNLKLLATFKKELKIFLYKKSPQPVINTIALQGFKNFSLFIIII